MRPLNRSFCIAGVISIDEKLIVFTSVGFDGSGLGTKNGFVFVHVVVVAVGVDNVYDVEVVVDDVDIVVELVHCQARRRWSSTRRPC